MSATFPSPTGLLIAVLAGVTACSGGPGEASPPDPVASVIVDPPYGRIEPGETVQLGASPRAENGDELPGRTVTWKSLAASIATVTTSGLVRAVAPGSAVISAGAEGSQGAALITVLGPVGSVTILRPSPITTLLPGEGVAWQAEVRDTGANILRRASVGWSSSDTAVATVDALGHVVGVAAGTAVIAATAGGIAGKAAVTVNPLSDLRGAWSMTEAEGCVASGPITLTQDLSRLTGTYQPSGTCRTRSGRSVDRFGPLHLNALNVNGVTTSSQVHFQTSGFLVCDYQGTIEGEPASRIRGSMQCETSEAGGDQIVIGTFTMAR